VIKSKRIDIIDAIRGFAVLGILFANIQSWSGYRFIPLKQIDTLDYAHLDRVFNSLHLWIVDGKFYAIFSILFGAGFGLQYLKNQGQMDSFIPVYRRRLALLFLFGIVHALFWSGDILTLYALLGFVMILMRDLPTGSILWLGIGLLLFFAIPQGLMLYFGPEATGTSSLAHKVYPDVTPGHGRSWRWRLGR
jgi:uncharacterized protein